MTAEGLSTEVAVEYSNGAHRCYTMPDGRTHRLVGCSHLSPKEAVRHAAELTERRRAQEEE